MTEFNTHLLRLALLVVAGRRYWLLPLLPLGWLGFQGLRLLMNDQLVFTASDAQGTLLGVPLALLASFLGIRIIAGELEDRSLEIAYTVPGGCERVWFTKLLACGLVLLASELILATVVYFLFTPFPLGALYGALQAASFYLVVAMAMATLFRGEAAGAMATAAILALNGVITGFGNNQIRLSPFWNPYGIDDADPTQIFAWTLQNRIGVLLVMIAIAALAFMRANRRERMLGG